jgi:hypothetical protein
MSDEAFQCCRRQSVPAPCRGQPVGRLLSRSQVEIMCERGDVELEALVRSRRSLSL